MSSSDQQRARHRFQEPDAQTAAGGSRANHLLGALPAEEFDSVGPKLAFVDLPYRQVLYEAHSPITHIHFFRSGIASLINVMVDGAVEVGIVGREGILGVPALMQVESISVRAIMQAPGSADLLPIAALDDVLNECPALRRSLYRYAESLFEQVAQSATCNALHTVEQRFARWLLATADRVDDTELPLTQQFLSHMLGVHRPAVSVAAGALQREGLISYGRARIVITDRAGLAKRACPCYRITLESSERLLGFRVPFQPSGTPHRS